MTAAKNTGKESGAKASDSKPSEKSGKKAESYATRYDANVAYFALSEDDREGLAVVEDEDTGSYSIQNTGK